VLPQLEIPILVSDPPSVTATLFTASIRRWTICFGVTSQSTKRHRSTTTDWLVAIELTATPPSDEITTAEVAAKGLSPPSW
jgi:hypothetical protein